MDIDLTKTKKSLKGLEDQANNLGKAFGGLSQSAGKLYTSMLLGVEKFNTQLQKAQDHNLPNESNLVGATNPKAGANSLVTENTSGFEEKKLPSSFTITEPVTLSAQVVNLTNAASRVPVPAINLISEEKLAPKANLASETKALPTTIITKSPLTLTAQVVDLIEKKGQQDKSSTGNLGLVPEKDAPPAVAQPQTSSGLSDIAGSISSLGGTMSSGYLAIIQAIMAIPSAILSFTDSISDFFDTLASFPEKMDDFRDNLPKKIADGVRGATVEGIEGTLGGPEFITNLVAGIESGIWKSLYLPFQKLFGGQELASEKQLEKLAEIGASVAGYRQEQKDALKTSSVFMAEATALDIEITNLDKEQSGYFDNLISLSEKQFETLKSLESATKREVNILQGVLSTLDNSLDSLLGLSGKNT
ncbi:MAG: hypothetical protein QNL04_00690, partial [SAR324 cluster bacterium]|nr:hypothetical protein [SAR324 cluster bacterium]